MAPGRARDQQKERQWRRWISPWQTSTLSVRAFCDRRGLGMARGRLENQLSDLAFPAKTNAANERLAQHLWNHHDELFTFLRQPGLDAINWRAELAIRFGVILRKVWDGSRPRSGARLQAVLMSVGRTCWQQVHSALDAIVYSVLSAAGFLDRRNAKPSSAVNGFRQAASSR